MVSRLEPCCDKKRRGPDTTPKMSPFREGWAATGVWLPAAENGCNSRRQPNNRQHKKVKGVTLMAPSPHSGSNPNIFKRALRPRQKRIVAVSVAASMREPC